MCGIAGAVGRHIHSTDYSRIELAHRGPDDYDEWSGDEVALAQWRLRVVDLSEAADQPMWTHDRRHVIVYNGEIYNAPELRRNLEEQGVRFKTHSDTEVVLNLIARQGASGARRLRGMFAFACWDCERQSLILGRDSFGIKPLVYCENADGVSFASELPALLSILRRVPGPDLGALWDFFTFGFVPGPATGFANVRKLMPGEIAEFDKNGRRCATTYLPEPWLHKGLSHRSSELSLRQAVIQAVREQFQADVPVGVFLSGGLDSNIIVASARYGGIDLIRTFTVRFEGPLEGDSNDEAYAARRSAAFFRTEHTEVSVRLSSPDELLGDLDRFGEPFANPTVYLTRLLSIETRKHVTVALAGLGGDELFGGYPRYAALRDARLLHGGFGQAASMAAKGLTFALGRSTPRAVRRVAWLTGATGRGSSRTYLDWTYYLNEREKAKLLPRLKQSGSDSISRLELSFSAGAPLGRAFLAGPLSDLSINMPDNLLAYTDIGSMAASLEVRVPLLDPDVAYLALKNLRAEDLGFYRPKKILRQTFADMLPSHVIHARKRGFNPPLARWIRDSLDGLLTGIETAAFRREFVNEEELARMRSAHKRGLEDYSQELFSVISAARWYAKWY